MKLDGAGLTTGRRARAAGHGQDNLKALWTGRLEHTTSA